MTTPLATPKLPHSSPVEYGLCFVLLSDECASLRMPPFSAIGKEFRGEKGRRATNSGLLALKFHVLKCNVVILPIIRIIRDKERVTNTEMRFNLYTWLGEISS